MAFKLDSIFNQKTLSQATDSYKVQYIERRKIVPNDRNKEIYNTNKILLLSYGIEDKGLLEPLIVKKESNGTYTLLSGHRRLLAIEALVERNPDKKAEFDVLPCIERNNGDENEEILIDANIYNRDKSDAEKAAELQRKKEILEQRKANGEKINGRLLELIASEMNISYHQAKKLNAINNNATEQVHDAFKDGEISTETAYQISKLDDDKQNELISESRKSNTTLTTKDVSVAVMNTSLDKNDSSTEQETDYSVFSEDNDYVKEKVKGASSLSDVTSDSKLDSGHNNSNTSKYGVYNEKSDICNELIRVMSFFTQQDDTVILPKESVSDIRYVLERACLYLSEN